MMIECVKHKPTEMMIEYHVASTCFEEMWNVYIKYISKNATNNSKIIFVSKCKLFFYNIFLILVLEN